MKTPREILFKQHEAIGPKLDAIRQQVLAGHFVSGPQAQAGGSASFFAPFWLELFWHCRRIWTGLAAVWVLLAVINFSQRDRSPAVSVQPHPSREMRITLRRQQEMLNELLADHSQPAEPARPRKFEPEPRSDIREITMV